MNAWHGIHIYKKISSKISVVNGILSRLKKFVPSDILKVIYNALIQPHLNYGVLLWGKNVKRIHKLQKWSMRAITSSKYNAHTDPLFIRLKLLKIHDIYKLSLLKFYFKYKKGSLPNFFTGMFDSIYPKHTYATRRSGQPVPATCMTIAAKNSVRFSLPDEISITPKIILDKLSTHSFYGFTNYAKTYFISQYNPSCTLENCYICNNSWYAILPCISVALYYAATWLFGQKIRLSWLRSFNILSSLLLRISWSHP